jgi:hypothetical protein
MEDHVPTPARLNDIVQPDTVLGPPREVYSFGSVRIYVEHNGKDLVSFPAHGMRGRVIAGERTFPLKVRQSREVTSAKDARDPSPVAVHYDGVTVKGPGAVTVDVEVADVDLDSAVWFETSQSVRYEIELDVLHAVNPLRVDVTLNRREDDWDSYDSENEYQRAIGQLDFNHPVGWMNGRS